MRTDRACAAGDARTPNRGPTRRRPMSPPRRHIPSRHASSGTVRPGTVRHCRAGRPRRPAGGSGSTACAAPPPRPARAMAGATTRCRNHPPRPPSPRPSRPDVPGMPDVRWRWPPPVPAGCPASLAASRPNVGTSTTASHEPAIDRRGDQRHGRRRGGGAGAGQRAPPHQCPFGEQTRRAPPPPASSVREPAPSVPPVA